MKLQTLNLSSEPILDYQLLGAEPESDLTATKTGGFWKRQFQEVPTRKQRVFDWAYGVVIPIICVAADPIVFRNDGILAAYRPFAYLLSSVSILAMAAWLLWGQRLGWLNSVLAGLFFVGACVSLLVGIILFPFSLLGLFVLIGFLGFTPLLSAIVYMRNGVRAYRSGRLALDNKTAWQAAVLAAVFSVVIPYVVNWEIYRLVQRVANGDVSSIRRNSAKLKYVAPLADLTPVVDSYFNRKVTGNRFEFEIELATAYKNLSGEDIESTHFWDW